MTVKEFVDLMGSEPSCTHIELHKYGKRVFFDVVVYLSEEQLAYKIVKIWHRN